MAAYEGTSADRLRHAAARLPTVVRWLALELASATEDPKFAAAVRQVPRVVANSARAAGETLRLAIVREGADPTPPPPPYQWLAPSVRARETFLSELLKLQADLRLLVGPDRERDRGASRSPSPFG